MAVILPVFACILLLDDAGCAWVDLNERSGTTLLIKPLVDCAAKLVKRKIVEKPA